MIRSIEQMFLFPDAFYPTSSDADSWRRWSRQEMWEFHSSLCNCRCTDSAVSPRLHPRPDRSAAQRYSHSQRESMRLTGAGCKSSEICGRPCGRPRCHGLASALGSAALYLKFLSPPNPRSTFCVRSRIEPRPWGGRAGAVTDTHVRPVTVTLQS